MHVITVSNVNQALPAGIKLLSMGEQHVHTVTRRGMTTVEWPEPVATVYRYPWECVLWDPDRDANPFFHLIEALWILGGHEDVETLAMYNENIRQYSDDGKVFHGAYGYRLRFTPQGIPDEDAITGDALGYDQLTTAAKMLRESPDSRRVVMTMWNPVLDLDTDSKDIPCNDLIAFLVREGKLHMTVFCRSNDIIWGAYGANAVQFAFIFKIMCEMSCLDMGTYTQVSHSYHAYIEDAQSPNQKRLWTLLSDKYNGVYVNPTGPSRYTYRPLPFLTARAGDGPTRVEPWDFLDVLSHCPNTTLQNGGWAVKHGFPFLDDLVRPIRFLWFAYKRTREMQTSPIYALYVASRFASEHVDPRFDVWGSTDWGAACWDWVFRREIKWSQRNPRQVMEPRVADSIYTALMEGE